MPKSTLDTLAFSIPYTKHHIRFIEETEALLKRERVPYRTHVYDDWYDQRSSLQFYVARADRERAEVCVTIASQKLVPRSSLGLPP